jgi:hypothetical protein
MLYISGKGMRQFLHLEDGKGKDIGNYRKTAQFSKVPSPTQKINISPKSRDVLTHTCNVSPSQLTPKKW